MLGKNDEICIINNTKRGNSKNDDSANYDFTIEFNYGDWWKLGRTLRKLYCSYVLIKARSVKSFQCF